MERVRHDLGGCLIGTRHLVFLDGFDKSAKPLDLLPHRVEGDMAVSFRGSGLGVPKQSPDQRQTDPGRGEIRGEYMP